MKYGVSVTFLSRDMVLPWYEIGGNENMRSRRYEKISISIPHDLASKLDKLAEGDGFSRSEIISKLIEFGLDNISYVSDLEPLRLRIDWPERNRVCDFEMKPDEEIILRTRKGALRILPWKEEDFVDIVPLKSNKAFERVSLWNTIKRKDECRYGKYVGSATLVCIGLGVIPRENADVDKLYDPKG